MLVTLSQTTNLSDYTLLESHVLQARKAASGLPDASCAGELREGVGAVKTVYQEGCAPLPSLRYGPCCWLCGCLGGQVE